MQWDAMGMGAATHPVVRTPSQRPPSGIKPHVPSSASGLGSITWEPVEGVGGGGVREHVMCEPQRRRWEAGAELSHPTHGR
jgi:hypothetical protein